VLTVHFSPRCPGVCTSFSLAVRRFSLSQRVYPTPGSSPLRRLRVCQRVIAFAPVSHGGSPAARRRGRCLVTHQHARRAEPLRQPACCRQGWPATGAPARRGMVPVARGDMGGVLGGCSGGWARVKSGFVFPILCTGGVRGGLVPSPARYRLKSSPGACTGVAPGSVSPHGCARACPPGSLRP